MTEPCIVEVELLDTKTREPSVYQLTPKLSAMKAINRFAGGYTGMFRALAQFDADAMVACIVAGTGAVGNPAKIIEERVYASDVQKLQPFCVRFVNVCVAGGRDPDVEVPAPAGGAASGNG